jgi:pilus assembly protein CpaC
MTPSAAPWTHRARWIFVAFGLNALLPASAHAQGPSSSAPRPASADASPAPFETWTLQIGEQRTLPTENVKSYSEGVKGIVDVRMTKDASQFVIVALARGKTTLLLMMMDGSERYYQIQVGEPEAAKRHAGEPGTVEARDNIRLDFYFVQLQKSYGHQLGLGWPGTVAPTFSATYDLKAGQLTSATAVISDQALPRLDIAQSTGWAKILRQAAVVTANGEKASFSGGGEVNVPIQSALTTGIQKIPFGSQIEVEPQYDAKTGRVELHLHADISELDNDRGTGVPGRVTSNLDTVVNLELGQSLVLGGLSARSERRSRSGLPGLSQIPILGIFFGTNGQAEDETENVVVIVPSVVDAVSMQSKARLDEALKAFADYSGNLEKVKFVPAAPDKSNGKVAPR